MWLRGRSVLSGYWLRFPTQITLYELRSSALRSSRFPRWADSAVGWPGYLVLKYLIATCARRCLFGQSSIPWIAAGFARAASATANLYSPDPMSSTRELAPRRSSPPPACSSAQFGLVSTSTSTSSGSRFVGRVLGRVLLHRGDTRGHVHGIEDARHDDAGAAGRAPVR